MGTITGTEADDYLTGTAGDDVILGLGGRDRVHAGGGQDAVDGGAGDDQLYGEAGDDQLSDTGDGSDLLDGGAGNDRIILQHLDRSRTETVALVGGDGNDVITSWSNAAGTVTVDGGIGDDVLILVSATGAHRITLGAGRDTVDLTRFQPTGMDGSVREVTDFAPSVTGDTVLLYDLLSMHGTWDGRTDPFASGILRLEQRGADAILQMVLRDGTALPHDLLIFRSAGAAAFAAENFGGFSPSGVPATARILTGTNSGVTLTGGYGNDLVTGSSGNDLIDGSAGDDQIEGGSGNDVIRGGWGDDRISAGAGDDLIDLSADGGSDFVDAGSGNDTIAVVRNPRNLFERPTIVAGEGHDTVRFQLYDEGRTLVDLGPGNDRFVLAGTFAELSLTLGAGADVLDLSRHDLAIDGQEAVTLTDYVPGEDRIAWGNWLRSELVGWDWHANPFAAGFLRLQEQVGQVVLTIDRDGPGASFAEAPAFVFSGLTASALTDADFILFSRPADDFNGDGRSDLLLRNANGLLTNWLGEAGGTFASNHLSALYLVPPEWKIAATGDFNGDGRSDILFRNDNGAITQWLGQGAGQYRWNAAASYPVDPGWSIAAAGDFNGDGRSDVVLRNANVLLTEWLGTGDGTFFSNDAIATYAIPVSWKVAGAGDFDGDGRSDLLLRNGDGTVTQWLGQSDGTFLWNAPATYALDPAWSVAGIGDVDGDGRADLILRNDEGIVTEWLGEANGTFTWNEAAIYSLAPDWHS